jgi:CRP/FNR family transcriptional regulator, cyclic AMP receptor protein
MEAHFWADQVDAHRILVQASAGRSTNTYEDGQQIYRQGEDASLVFFVQDGCVDITRFDQGKEWLVGTARPGKFFGEACLYDTPVRLSTATAIGDCRITSVTKKALLCTIRSQPRFARMFIDYLSGQNSWTQKHLLEHLLEPEAA